MLFKKYVYQTTYEYLSLLKDLSNCRRDGTGITCLQLAAESSYVPYPLYGGNGRVSCFITTPLSGFRCSHGVKSSAVNIVKQTCYNRPLSDSVEVN
jgi:hypothetical protein